MSLLMIVAASTIFVPQAGMKESAYLLEKIIASKSHIPKRISAHLELFIDPKGNVEECTPLQVNGEQEAADEICKIMKRTRIGAPKDAAGRPIHALTYMAVSIHGGEPNWREKMKLSVPGRLELTVNRLPPEAGVAKSLSIPLLLGVGADGKVAVCEAAAEEPADYVQVACAEIGKQSFEAKIGRDGAAVPYVRKYFVTFALDE